VWNSVSEFRLGFVLVTQLSLVLELVLVLVLVLVLNYRHMKYLIHFN
jgi:hypothetical protein